MWPEEFPQTWSVVWMNSNNEYLIITTKTATGPFFNSWKKQSGKLTEVEWREYEEESHRDLTWGTEKDLYNLSWPSLSSPHRAISRLSLEEPQFWTQLCPTSSFSTDLRTFMDQIRGGQVLKSYQCAYATTIPWRFRSLLFYFILTLKTEALKKNYLSGYFS